jgi:class 3 adenylate cyclase
VGAGVSDIAFTPSGPTAPSGERRQVTVLFADMVGFTAISERLGEEGTFALIQPIYELMAGAVKEQGGSASSSMRRSPRPSLAGPFAFSRASRSRLMPS